MRTQRHARHKRHANKPKSRVWILLVLSTSLMPITTAGCGETASTPTAASRPAASTAPTGDSSTTAAAQPASNTAATPPSQQTQAQGASSPTSTSGSVGATHARAHLVLPGPDSKPAPKLSSAQRANLPVSDITLSSPAITQAHLASTPTLNQRYTCQGSNQSPPLHWSAIPAATKELVLLVASTKPVNGKLFYDWAVASLNPTLKGLNSGALPPGAVTGRNSAGKTAYSICPTGANHESYVFLLYALPQSLHPQPGFDPASLRQQATQIAHHTGLLIGTYG